MKLSDLQKEVNKDIDDSLANEDITGWLNRALDDLSPFAKYQKAEPIILIPDQRAYALPGDLLEIVHLMDENQQKLFHAVPLADFTGEGYKRWGNEIRFQPAPKEDGQLTLYYFARLPHLENPDDVPAIPEEYHDLLVLYAVARAKYQDEEESMQHNAMQEYLARREQFMAFSPSYDSFQIQEVYW